MTQCTDGCLKCNVVDEDSSLCDVCDVFSFYVPFGNGLCIKVDVENCDVPSADRSQTKCMKCKDGFIYDTTTRKCKEVAHSIEFCQEYDSDGKCMMCQKNYMIDAEACKLVDPLINNCLVYTNDDPPKCQTCENGYYMNLKDQTCVAVPSDSDCLMFTRRKCLSCQSGYLLNENYSLKQEMSSAFLQNLAYASFTSTAGSTSVGSLPISNCQKVLVADCAVYESFEKCSTCNSGFYLAEEGKSCLKFPEDPIKLCEIYSDNSTCLKCVNGAYKSGADCLESANVDGCITYSQSEDKCIECEYGKYLNNSICVLRQSTLQSNQCQTLNPEDDKCSLCNPGFTLDNSETSCLAIIEHCTNSGVDNSGNVTCSQCATDYGLNSDGICVLKNIENCDGYDGFTANCSVCISGYYIDTNSNSCKKLTVENCQDPFDDSDACETCNTYFYLDGNVCKLQNKTNCIGFDTNTNDCNSCQEKYYLDLTTKSCSLYSVENCTVLATNDNSCETCDTGYYKTENTTTTATGDFHCVKQEIPGCEDYTDQLNECEDCEFPGYWLDGTTCTEHVTLNSNCKEFEETSADCKTCDTGFFLITDAADGTLNTCLTQTNSLTGCVEYVDNKKECSKCENLTYLDTGTATCTDITDKTNCLIGDTSADACLICKPGFYLLPPTPPSTDPAVCTARSSQTDLIDPLCSGNTHSEDDGICTKCQDSNQIAFYVDKYSVFPKLDNCLDYKDDLTCQRCAEGFKSTDATTCGNTVDANLECVLKTNAATALNDGTDESDCEKCAADFYLTDDGAATPATICEARGKSVINCDSDGLSPSSDACLYCPINSVYEAMTDIVSCTNNSYDGDTFSGTVADCLVFDGDDLTKCLFCTNGDAGDDCSTDNSSKVYMENIISTDYSIEGFFEVTDTQTSCEAGRLSLSNTNIGTCIECENDTDRKLIGSYNSSTQTWNGVTYDKADTDSPFTDKLAYINGCNVKATPLLFGGKMVSTLQGDGVTYADEFTVLADSTSADADEFSYLLQTVDNVIALGCKDEGKVPTFDTATHSADTVAVTGSYFVSVISCADDTAYANISKRYKGLGYGYQATDSIPLEAIIYKDSCKFETEILVYFFTKVDSSNDLTLKAVAAGGNAFCVKDELDDESATHSATSYLPNCQIFLAPAAETDTSNFATTAQTLECLSCKPGYYGARTSATDPTIVTPSTATNPRCEPILNCDTSLENFNVWMNACQKCKDGYAWTYDASDTNKEFILYHECASTTATNCKVVDKSTNNNCVFCEPGYTLNSSFECVKIEITGCSATSLGRFISSTNLSTALTDLVQVQKINSAVNYLFPNQLTTATNGYGCQTCEGSYKKISTATAKLCLGTKSFFSGISNCKHHTVNAAGGCSECDSGYVVDSSTPPVCVSLPAGKGSNCLEIDDSNNCTSCSIGVPISDDCKPFAKCQELNSTKDECKVCKEGYKPVSGDLTECEEVVEDTPCKLFGKGGICLECKDNTKSPVNYFSDATTPTLFRIVCVNKYFDENNTNANGRMANAVYSINNDATTFETKFSVLDVNTSTNLYLPNANPNVTSTRTTSNSPPFSVCIEKPKTDFCAKYETEDNDPTNDFQICTECIPGYVLDTTSKLCTEGPVLNCKSYDTSSTLVCSECTSDFYLNATPAPGICEVRLDKSCKTYNVSADNCTECDSNKYFKDNTCHVYTVDNCLAYNENENQCDSCVVGQRYLTTDGICVPYSVEFCKTYTSDSDACASCENNRFLSSTSNSCELYSVTNCDNFETASDACTDCKNGFFLNSSNNCVLPSAENCQTRSTTEDKCTSCVNGYYLDGTAPSDCLENTAVNCSQMSITENKCTTCLPAHFVDAGNNDVCTAHTAEFCVGYEINANECIGCEEGYYKDTDNVCKLNSSSFCKTKSTTSNVCVVCKDEYYLNSSNQCEKITNFTCLKLQDNSNDCLTCNPDDYLDSVTKTCMKVTKVENCAEYESNADECDTCSTGYYLGPSKKACYQNPNGILGCAVYQDSLTCQQCNSSTFLENNKCVTLTQPTVTDCAGYSADGTCSVCASNKFLNSTDNSCEDPTVTGCLTYEDKENCATCASNQYLNGTPKVCSDTTINGCLVVSGTFEAQTCAVCDSSSYLNTDNECTSVTNTVTDCSKYSDDGVCEVCGVGQETNSDGSSCQSISSDSFGLHCSSGTNTATPVCAFCKDGKLLGDNGTCSESCEASNCMVCNPQDTTKCLMCSSGYYMNTKMECVVNGTPSEEESNEDDDNSVRLMSSFILVSLLMNLLWK